jgi:uncharacterized protein (TIRG00374 family)
MTKLKTALKIGLSLLLLGYLVQLAQPEKIVQVLGQVWQNGRLVYLSLAIGIYLISTVVFTLRWQILVRGYGLLVTSMDLFKYYLIGLFFNNFLPTSIGGDVVRIYHLIEKSGDRTAGFTSVFTERLLGIASTLILTLISLFLLRGRLDNNLMIYIACGLLIIIIAFFGLIFNDRLLQLIEQLVNPFKLLRLGERAMKFFKAIRFYYNTKDIYLKIVGISLLGQVLVIIMTCLLSLAIGLRASWSYLFLVVPISFLVTMLPSINGIGFREGVYIIMLGQIGVSKAEAISLSFLSILIPMIVSVGGGILFMLNKQVPKKKELEFVKKNI